MEISEWTAEFIGVHSVFRRASNEVWNEVEQEPCLGKEDTSKVRMDETSTQSQQEDEGWTCQ